MSRNERMVWHTETRDVEGRDELNRWCAKE